MGLLRFVINLILQAALWHWGRLSLKNDYQGISPVGKGGRCVGLTALPPLCAYCPEIWDSQAPGDLRACPGLYRDGFQQS